jgi:hypothetical protein
MFAFSKPTRICGKIRFSWKKFNKLMENLLKKTREETSPLERHNKEVAREKVR